MTRQQYLDQLGTSLAFMAAGERDEIVREFTSHLDDTVAGRPDLSEEEIIDRLPPPASIAAQYQAEAEAMADPDTSQQMADQAGAEGQAAGADQSASTDQHNSQARYQSSRKHHDGQRFRDMFSHARAEAAELSGLSEGVERVEVRSPACNLDARIGETFSYRIRGHWDDTTLPQVTRSGGRWSISCGPDAEQLELVLAPTLVELVVTSASGDISVELPPMASLIARVASADVSCQCDGGAAAVSSASGEIVISGRVGQVEVSSASGDIRIEAALGDVNAASQSGDIMVRSLEPEADIKARSMSGDVYVHLASGSTAEILAESISGDVSAPGERIGPVGHRTRAAGGPGQVHAKSVSGVVRVYKQG
jgi:hypothetical protein